MVWLPMLLSFLLPGDPGKPVERAMVDARSYNRLADEQSPYLLQHKENPVDWYPWSDEAMERARQLDRPIFLSIGYSTCHWCHVMAHESFENEEVARLLNENYVSIKVDREERPDIDHIYMTACQMMTGSGGWPLTIVMTPAGEPFFAATYIPRETRFGRSGMLELLPRISSAWAEERPRIEAAAGRARSSLAASMATAPGQAPGLTAIAAARTGLASRFDSEYGGFGERTKFPTPHNLTLLLRDAERTGDEQPRKMVEKTLTAMYEGGLFDHLGNGFHRYSTDPKWRLPHFEKMLYDQALLAIAYLEAHQYTGEQLYATVALKIFDYVGRDLASPEGAFYSAEDADSEGEEGRFYVWDYAELSSQLSESELDLAQKLFGIHPEGNFVDSVHPEAPPRNVLYLANPVLPALRPQTSEQRVAEEQLRRRLLELRGERVRPSLDDKILTDWNGLMMAAYARAGFVLDSPELLERAAKVGQFIHNHLMNKDGDLLHRYRNGEAGILGQLEDHAFYAFGLLELYEASFEPRYLQRAVDVVERMMDAFAAEDGGGLYQTAKGGEKLIVRPREHYDGALPAGNSVAADVMLRLARLTGRVDLEGGAETLLASYANAMGGNAAQFTRALHAADFAAGPSFEVVLAMPDSITQAAPFLALLRATYLPRVVVHVVSSQNRKALGKLAPYVLDQVPQNGLPTAYVCKAFTCKRPTNSPEEMLHHLQGK
jgi:uncharacterized protein